MSDEFGEFLIESAKTALIKIVALINAHFFSTLLYLCVSSIKAVREYLIIFSFYAATASASF